MRSQYAASHVMWDSDRCRFVAKRVLKMVKTDPKTGREYTALFGDVSLKTDRFAPTEHIWTSAKQAWLKLDDDLLHYPEAPPG